MDRVPEPLDDEPDVPETIRVATELKNQGNQKFKGKQWNLAQMNYQEALNKLDGCASQAKLRLELAVSATSPSKKCGDATKQAGDDKKSGGERVVGVKKENEKSLDWASSSAGTKTAGRAVHGNNLHSADQKGDLCMSRALSASVQSPISGSLKDVDEVDGQALDEKKNKKNWANLPPNVIEIIVLHAVKGAKKSYECDYNWFPMRVRKYALVHPLWKRAILCSRSIFHQKKSFPLNWAQGKSVDIYFGFNRSRDEMPIELIKEGYLQSVQWLSVVMEREGDLKPICDSLRARNSIQGLVLSIHPSTCTLSDKIFCQMSELVKLMTKAIHFEIRIPIITKAEAKRLWKLTRLVVQTNSLPKFIKFDYGKTIGIDWSFVNQDNPVGTVDQFYVQDLCPSIGFLSHLTNIETLTINIDQLWGSDGAYLDKTEAKCLQITTCPSIDPHYYRQFLHKLTDIAIVRKIKVKMVEIIVIEGDFKTVKYQNTFESGASMWTNFKDSFLPIFQAYLDELSPGWFLPQNDMLQFLQMQQIQMMLGGFESDSD